MLKWTTTMLLWAAITIVTIMAALSYMKKAHAGDRLEIYNSRGERQGYVKPSPYTGRCCEIYNNRGERTGVLRDNFRSPPPRVGSEKTHPSFQRDRKGAGRH